VVCALASRADLVVVYTRDVARTSCKETLFALQTPTRQADVYTLRICGRDARPDLLSQLRSAVTDMGGTVVVDVVEGRGFMCVCSTILEYAY
jgi:hypothetical protein